MYFIVISPLFEVCLPALAFLVFIEHGSSHLLLWVCFPLSCYGSCSSSCICLASIPNLRRSIKVHILIDLELLVEMFGSEGRGKSKLLKHARKAGKRASLAKKIRPKQNVSSQVHASTTNSATACHSCIHVLTSKSSPAVIFPQFMQLFHQLSGRGL